MATLTSSSATHAADTATAQPSKARKIGLRVVLGLLTFLYFVTGAAKVVMLEFMMTNMAEINFGTVPTMIIGVIEVIAVVGLWLPRYRTLSLSVLLLIMAGAAGAHWGFGHPVGEVLPSFIVAGLTFAALWLDRGRALWDFVLRR